MIDQLIQDQLSVVTCRLETGTYANVKSALDRLGFCGRMWIKMGYKTQTTSILQKIETEAKGMRPPPHRNQYDVDALLNGVEAAKVIFEISY